MKRLMTLLSRVLRNDWREIASAPFDRAIEVATIEGNTNAPGRSCLRHGDGWLDTETLRPVEISATHWRYRPSLMPPMSCC
jgi:hypothetical protein